MGHADEHAKFALSRQGFRAKVALHNDRTVRDTPRMVLTTPEWLAQGLQKPGKTQAELAKILGVDPSVVSKMKSGKRRILAGELDKIASYIEEPVPFSAKNDATMIYKRGKVAAGVWREVETADQGEAEAVPIPRDPRYPHVEQYALEVEGDSANRVAANGWLVICVPYWDVRREITAGDLVHVERRQADGKRENTLKRVRMGRDGPELWPESSSPLHQKPVPVASVDGSEVEIVGLVIYSCNPNP